MAILRDLKAGRTFLASLPMPLGRSEYIGSVSRHNLKPKEGLKRKIIIKQISKQTNEQNLSEVFGVLEPKNLI